MPSIFHSAAAGLIRPRAAAMSGADAASIGRAGRPTRSVKPRRAASARSAGELAGGGAGPVPPSAAWATSGSDPPSWCARADLLGRDARGPGDRVGHDALERALPEIAGQQPDQELPLALGGPGEQPGEQPAPLGLRAGPGHRADRPERGVDVG